MVKQKAPALLIVDASLPDRDGIAVLEEAQRIDSRMIGVVMAGAASVELAARAMRAGASDLLTKPFQSIRRLIDRVGALVSSPPVEKERPTAELPKAGEPAEAAAEFGALSASQ